MIYIDTGATFSTERIKEIVGGKFTGSGNETVSFLLVINCLNEIFYNIYIIYNRYPSIV